MSQVAWAWALIHVLQERENEFSQCSLEDTEPNYSQNS